MNWIFEKGEVWYRTEKRGFLPSRPDVVHWKGYAAYGVLVAVYFFEIWILSLFQAPSLTGPLMFATMLVFLAIYHRHHEIIDPDNPPPKSSDTVFPGGRRS